MQVIDGAFADDCVAKGTFGSTAGKEAFKKEILAPFFEALPDLKYAANDVAFQGSRFANRFTLAGTHSGADLYGVRATGKAVHISGAMITHQDTEGAISELHAFFDKRELLQQLRGEVTARVLTEVPVPEVGKSE